jgi:hypothetical protein
MEADQVLSLQEISKTKAKYLQDLLFFKFGNLISYFDAQESFTTEGERIHVTRFTSDICQEISACIFSAETFIVICLSLGWLNGFLQLKSGQIGRQHDCNSVCKCCTSFTGPPK